MGDKLLRQDAYFDKINNTAYCTKEKFSPLWNEYCKMENDTVKCDRYFEENQVKYIDGIPGFRNDVMTSNLKSCRMYTFIKISIFADNIWPKYMLDGETAPGLDRLNHAEISQDLTSTFFVLLAIIFPSVTGIMTGRCCSGILNNISNTT